MKPKSKEAQCKLVEKDLKAGKKVSTWQAIKDHKITRISARVWDLRQAGMNIITNMVEKEGKRYAEYKLSHSGK